MKTACIGIGAVGSIIARELKQLDIDVTLFSREEQDGFTILEDGEYTTYPWHIHPLDSHKSGTYDLIFIAVKATAMKSVSNAVKSMSHDTTEIILCANGMGYDGLFQNPVPSVVYISGQKHPNYIEHFRDSRLIIENTPLPFTDQLIKNIEQHAETELVIEKSSEFKRLRYEKLLINLGVNSMTALTQNTAQIFSDEDILHLTRLLLEEGKNIINQDEQMIDDDFVETSIALYQSYPDHMGTSMYYDVSNKVKTEFEYIQKYFYQHKNDLHTPVLDVVYTLLKGYQIKR